MEAMLALPPSASLHACCMVQWSVRHYTHGHTPTCAAVRRDLELLDPSS